MLANEPGVRIPETLPVEVVNLLDTRIGDEYTAHFYYRNAANWCKGVNYNKAAAFFEGEAAAELEHALGLQNYLTQWNIMPQIPPFPTTRNFANLVDVVNGAYDMELGLYKKYSADQGAMLPIHVGTFNFLQQYVGYQDAEVAEYSDLLNALQLINVENKLDVLMFEEKYFG